MKLRFGSVSSGIGGDAVAFHPLGWETVFFAENAEFPSAVLQHRFPKIPNLGDYTAPDFCERARACGPIDGLAGGTPCQAYSIAGTRDSLDDDRGQLTMRFVEITHELNPAIVVWENVPGVLNTKDNAFGCFIAGMVGESEPLKSGLEGGRWPNAGMVIGPKRTFAWRILDAQYFGVAQRRRRVCVVSFRTCDGINPGAVLFEPDCLPRHSEPGTGPRKETTEAVACDPDEDGESVGGGKVPSHWDDAGQPHPTLGQCNNDDGIGQSNQEIFSQRGGGTVPCYWDGGQVTDCLDSSQILKQQTMPEKRRFPAIIEPCAFNARQDPDVSGNIAGPLDSSQPQAQAIAFDTTQITHPENRSNPQPGDPAPTMPKHGHATAVADGLRVRRLMPVEAERLQGFPDHWTRIPWKGKAAKNCPDGKRNEALGNAWATVVFTWIGRRIELVLEAFGLELGAALVPGQKKTSAMA